ncbi:hypothetical protein C8R44DRAFT_774336 [Mycena epipterygia]|nr:hypothetical protein C8R44DRAFT_774336 [Mycena epipterygia]
MPCLYAMSSAVALSSICTHLSFMVLPSHDALYVTTSDAITLCLAWPGRRNCLLVMFPCWRDANGHLFVRSTPCPWFCRTIDAVTAPFIHRCRLYNVMPVRVWLSASPHRCSQTGPEKLTRQARTAAALTQSGAVLTRRDGAVV